MTVIRGLVLALALTTLTGAAGTAVPDRSASDFSRSVLTSDDSRYRFVERADGSVVVKAPRRNPDSNRREVFSEPGDRATRDQTTCATWADQSDVLVQPGLAARIVDRRGRVRAITLTKNTVFGVDWVFNVVTWDTARVGDPWRRVAQFDMGAALGTTELGVEPFPWRVCLRVTGRTADVKVWLPEKTAEPTWDDPVYARSTTVPAAFDMVGTPGWYVGHVPPGGRVVFADLTTTI